MTVSCGPRCDRVRKVTTLSLLLILFLLPKWAEGADATIRATYRPATGVVVELGRDGPCGRWLSLCQSERVMGAMNLPFQYRKESVHSAGYLQDRFYVGVPKSRTVTVRNERTGDTHDMLIEFTHVSIYNGVKADSDRFDFSLNPVNTYEVAGGCTALHAFADSSGGAFIWRLGTSGGGCAALGGKGASPGLRSYSRVSGMGAAYKLTVRSPEKMAVGTYRGTTNFTAGQGTTRDFSFGSHVTDLNQESMSVDIEFIVQQPLVVRFPPGADRALLEPPGGWRSWVGRGTPPYIEREIPFRLSSAGPFKVSTVCSDQLPGLSLCQISNGPHRAPTWLELTLPPNVRYGSGPVQRLNIAPGREYRFTTTTVVSNERGSLRFFVRESNLASMLKYPGTTYKGQVTVIFDADI